LANKPAQNPEIQEMAKAGDAMLFDEGILGTVKGEMEQAQQVHKQGVRIAGQEFSEALIL
jgi:hypothetical protein